MSIKKLITEIENTSPEAYEQVSSRRDMFSSFGSKVALAALPLAISSIFQKASAQTTVEDDIAVLNFILEMEFMTHTYFYQGANTNGLIPAADKAGFVTIAAQDKAHIAWLEKMITDREGTPFRPKYYGDSTTVHPYVPAAYDFTMGGKYTPFASSSYATFLTIGQILKDTQIHALQGLMVGLQSNNDLLVKIVSLQGTEARHAAHVRIRRRLAVNAPETPTPWIQNNIPPTVAFQKYYLGEDNVMQKDINIQTLQNPYYNGGTMPQVAATAAFDEPYTKDTVMTLLTPFKKI